MKNYDIDNPRMINKIERLIHIGELDDQRSREISNHLSIFDYLYGDS